MTGPAPAALRALDRVLAAVLLLFAFSLTVGIALTQISLFVAIVLWLAKCGVSRRWLGFATPLDKWFGLFLAACLLATAFSPRPADSAAMLKKFYLITPVYLLQFAVKDARQLRWLAGSFLAGAALTAGYGLAKVAIGVDGRLLGTQPTAMHSGGIYMMAALLALSLLSGSIAARQRGRAWALAAAGAAVVAGLALTKTISAWAGWVAGLTLLIRRRWWWLVAAVALAAVALLAVTFRDRPMEAWLFFTGNKPVSLQIRFNLWRMGWHLFQQRPLTGFGLISLQDQYCHIPCDNPYWGIAMSTGHLHNNFIQFAVTTGAVGLAAFVLMWTAVFRELAAALRVSGPALRPVARGGLACAVGFMVMGLAEYNFGSSVPVTVMWTMLGLALAARRIDGAAAATGSV
jgi:O-antigen ligase